MIGFEEMIEEGNNTVVKINASHLENWRLENYPYAVHKQRNGEECWAFFRRLRDTMKRIERDKQRGWQKREWRYIILKNTGGWRWMYEKQLGAKMPRYEYEPIDVPLSIALLLEG